MILQDIKPMRTKRRRQLNCGVGKRTILAKYSGDFTAPNKISKSSPISCIYQLEISIQCFENSAKSHAIIARRFEII